MAQKKLIKWAVSVRPCLIDYRLICFESLVILAADRHPYFQRLMESSQYRLTYIDYYVVWFADRHPYIERLMENT